MIRGRNGLVLRTCLKYFDTCVIYRVTLEDPDDDEEVDNCTIVIGLIQKGRRKQKRVGAQNLTIGFAIYQVSTHLKA